MAAGNPMSDLIMRALMARTGGGGGVPGQPGGMGMPGMPGMPGAGGAPGGGGNPGDQFASQVSELKGADPGGLIRQLKAIKQICAIILVQNMERLPNVSGKVSKLIPMLDQVIKEAQQASSVNNAVRNPIGMGAAQPSQPEGAPPSGPNF